MGQCGGSCGELGGGSGPRRVVDKRGVDRWLELEG
uniref:Uncharacterized protein n=1 Tax=Arundo donax TaxID=35708 RepID=A0A0A9FY37_ARUDO